MRGREFDAVIAVRERSAGCVPDNGIELTIIAILRRFPEHQIASHYIASGKPRQSVFVESFDKRLRDELVN